MKILVHDYAGHPFQVQLSRALAQRGHQVRPIGELPGVRPLPGMAVHQVVENMSRYEL